MRAYKLQQVEEKQKAQLADSIIWGALGNHRITESE